ncbi:hypothetical protein EQG49_12835 [Periweissella cryptocerci]|uniref:Uncharacterized protein n=1 Tax=Periweissella cryptocerci TaxID=2506420 RepID=A0A4P6YWP3_9LACO|nr:hypothetical protein [Periweissella cryptocerci]QBO37282.1 hypothetical protein EQG49_12835 [Periweissella cryptocerci]
MKKGYQEKLIITEIEGQDAIEATENTAYVPVVEGVDTEYTFTFPGVEVAQSIVDNAVDGTQRFMKGWYYEGLMDLVITAPESLKLNKWDWWESHKNYMFVMNAADKFLTRCLNA